MEPRKLTKEDIDKVRHIDGFPIAKDEDIIALSNAPYYTACPNPFIGDFIREYGKPYDEETDDYHREPFAFDVSEGKNDPIYNAHSYHTKVPYKAIMRYILHYTDPGDIVFDGFSGTGMTGVAALMCDIPDSLNDFKYQIETDMQDVKWGKRNAILNDLSPIASFITHNYNRPIDIQKYKKEVKRIIRELEKECEWVYITDHKDEQPNLLNNTRGKIDYIVWSDVLICSNCNQELVFYDVAVDENGKVKETFICPNCLAELKKNELNKKTDKFFDHKTGETIDRAAQSPVLKVYKIGNKRYEDRISEYDKDVIKKIEELNLSKLFYPTDLMLFREGKWGDIHRSGYHKGYFRAHHFYSKKNLYVLSVLWEKINECKDESVLKMLIFTFTGALLRLNRTNKYLPSLKMAPGPIMGMLYIPSLYPELNVINGFNNKVKNIERYWNVISNSSNYSVVTNQSSTNMTNIETNTIDYIFVDPPFGDNIMYSESNFLWESWLGVYTNMQKEAIVNKVQNKNLIEYQELMSSCFSEFFRILKPNRWITIEFHNSKNAVWNSIQEGLNRAGFIVADVRTLDKKQGSFKQVTTTSAVKQDLVISAYKPKDSFRNNFINNAGNEATVWDFIIQHLNNLPVVVLKNGKIEIVAERQAYLLFDRMVAYHIMNGISVPLDATDFYRIMNEKFLNRDGMYFLPDQINEYDTARITNDVEPIQFELFVTNEKSAISWLYQQLDSPQTYAEIQPKFMQEIKAWDKFEERPELNTLLEENFLQNDDGKWYVPDVTKAADVIKLREKKLLKEFEGYLSSKGKLKLFRTEAVRVGFAKLWTDKNYKLIVETADRLPESVIQEDDKLLMYYDISLGRI